MLAGCKFFVIKFCLMNKEKVLGSVLAITHVYVVTFCYLMLEDIVQRSIDGYDVHEKR